MNNPKPQKQTFKNLGELRAVAINHHKNAETKKAKDLYRLFLSRQPNDAGVWSNLGVLFRTEKNYQMALLCQTRALQLEPDADSILNNGANAYFDAGDVENALILRKKALDKDPSNVENWTALGKYLRALGRHDEARIELEKALKAHPDEPELHIQLSFAYLSLGDYPKGFDEFNWRWQGDEISLPAFDFPQWKGQDIKGKTILISPEQGFGDTVLMARFLQGLLDLGATIKAIVKPPLRRVFGDLQKTITFINSKEDIAGCDYWSPMMDLPLYLKTTMETVPAPVHLHIPPDSKERAKMIVAPFKDKFKVGVLWSGSVTYRANHKRSFGHQQFLQLADIPNLQMFSLYKGTLTDAFHEDGTSCIIQDAASNDRDFADSAALIQELDLVITMDSAIAHVSGSLGANVWNLLHSEAYWLYEPFVDHTPWYPSMRLIRQEKSGDWDTVFQKIRTELLELVPS